MVSAKIDIFCINAKLLQFFTRKSKTFSNEGLSVFSKTTHLNKEYNRKTSRKNRKKDFPFFKNYFRDVIIYFHDVKIYYLDMIIVFSFSI